MALGMLSIAETRGEDADNPNPFARFLSFPPRRLKLDPEPSVGKYLSSHYTISSS